VERFRARLRKLRTTATLFDNPVTVYMAGGYRAARIVRAWIAGQLGVRAIADRAHGRLACLI